MFSEENNSFIAEEAVEQLKNNYYFSYFRLASLRSWIIWCFSFGTIVFILRNLEYESNFLYLFFIGLPISIYYGITYANDHKLSDEKCYAAIDAFNNAGGLLLSEIETGDKRWRNSRKKLFYIPRTEVITSFRESKSILFIAFLFVLCSLYVPLPKQGLFYNKKIDLKQKTDEIREQIELLKQENVISQEEQKELEASLDNITNNSDKETPGVTFEGLDQMKEKLRFEAEEEMKKRIKNIESIKKLEDFIKEAKELEAERKSVNEAFEKLKNQLRKAGMNENEINEFLKQNFGEDFFENGLNNKKNLDSYSNNLNENVQNKINKTLDFSEKLQNNNLLDNNTARKIQQSLEGTSKNSSSEATKDDSFFNIDNKDSNESEKVDSNLSTNSDNSKNSEISNENSANSSSEQSDSKNNNEAGLETNSNETENENIMEQNSGEEQTMGENGIQGQSGIEGQKNGTEQNSSNEMNNSGQETMEIQLGNGGISKGGGVTPLTYGDKASDHNAKFHDETLPEVNGESALNSTVYGLGIANPKVNKEKVNYESIQFKNNEKNVNNINDKNLLPKYRNTVKKYFDH